MTQFELVFSLFSLLIGLAIAEVLGGFARSVRLRRSTRPVRIGWLTPLLGLFVILDLLTFLSVVYGFRDQLGGDGLTLIGVLTVVGVYYLAASLIFPQDPDEWPDFDDHYDRQNRAVIGGLLLANLGSAIGQLVIEIVRPTPEAQMPSDAAIIADGLSGLLILALLIALIIVKSRRTNAILLLALIGLQLVAAFADSLL